MTEGTVLACQKRENTIRLLHISNHRKKEQCYLLLKSDKTPIYIYCIEKTKVPKPTSNKTVFLDTLMDISNLL